MKEFVVYTLLRLGLFVGAFAIVAGVWSQLADSVPVLWALVLAFLISGVASLTMLNSPREAFAAKVEQRAGRITDKMDAQRAKEDTD
ncbi:DUF4229 domain-containing protein [Nocardioides alcanivorans]|uniref:DUF4229 domain-containing protein n=1 Tax=Nocardioides alcanivorans TaxID=2897352 RepID=UPI001F43114A|nr:DUF4229 domain-containing protein [Nocardioides alcanivorans]